MKKIPKHAGSIKGTSSVGLIHGTGTKGPSQRTRKNMSSFRYSYESVLANEFFIHLAEKSRSVFWIRSADYKKQLYISPAYEKIWGRSCQNLYEHPESWSDHLVPEDRHRLAEEVLKRNPNVTSATQYDEWYRIIRPDGEVRWIKDTSFPIHNNVGDFIGFAGIAEDITEQKKHEYSLVKAKEQAEAANRAKTEFLANMSHDVKTPLSGIISFSEILSSRIQEEYRPLIQDILSASKYLMTFFQNCVDLAKAENGSIALAKEAFSVKSLLQGVLALFQPAVKAKGLTLHVDYDEKIPKQILGSHVTFYRILLNLMSNAIKFTPQGSISVSATLDQKSTSNQIVITILDTGIGIPANKQGLIFERFTRLTPSYEGVYEGNGIGLSIVKEFVEAMDGEIHVKSEEGKGSQFTVVVPFQVPPLADSEHDEEDKVLPATLSPVILSPPTIDAAKHILFPSFKPNFDPSSRPKILLVEDNLMAKNGAMILLNSLGCEVDTAECGAEAITLFAPGKYKLVFMDIGLPDMKGYQVAERLREMEQGTAFHVPILALSAHATQEDTQLSVAAGMDEMHTKPLLLDKATLLIKKYIAIEDDTHLF
jgi:PAS domain S-box-containing protein